ncbi:unnamed protein product [Brassica napus]|uniref:(rape) hypothetical protein n=1 Tax=Brassica napus TaxID=3708 RepID=A0A816ING0_BRANA|nr:unnamed protein product [Brassica napus]
MVSVPTANKSPMGKGVANSLTSRQLRSRLQHVRNVVLAWPWPRFCRSNEGNCTAGAHHRTRTIELSSRFVFIACTPLLPLIATDSPRTPRHLLNIDPRKASERIKFSTLSDQFPIRKAPPHMELP